MKYKLDHWYGKYPTVYPGDIVHVNIHLDWLNKDCPQDDSIKFLKVLAIEDWKPACSDPVLKVAYLFYPEKGETTVGVGWVDWVQEVGLEDFTI